MSFSALTPWFWVVLALAFVALTVACLVTRASCGVNPAPVRQPAPKAPEWEFSGFWDGEPAPLVTVS